MSQRLTSNPSRWRFVVLLLGFGWGMLQVVAASVPVETRVQAVFIWGTNDPNPADTGLKEVDAKLRERLCNIFKWQNYFEVSRKTAGVTASKPQTVKLSEECSVDIRILPENMAEVKLIGKGKTIVTRRHSLAKPDALVLAGDDKNNTAWFLVLNFN
jgi:hypothetical protein